ncbi:MAG: 3-isopropylmalate dehydratase small subunit [Candidatus Sulfomarinibacteraceae bacterium]
MIIEGRAVVVPGDDVNTDVLYPGPYLNIDDPERMKDYLFEGIDPSLRDRLGGPTVLVVGRNFGGGSSREHVPLAMKAWGVEGVVGRSFARIFFRNCMNLGLPAIVCPDAVGAVVDDAAVRIIAEEGRVVVDGREFSAPVLPPFVIDMVKRGGLVPYVRGRLESRKS